jgi:hypothetical protein
MSPPADNASSLPDELKRIVENAAGRKVSAAQIADAIRAAGSYRWVGVYDVDEGRARVSNIA